MRSQAPSPRPSQRMESAPRFHGISPGRLSTIGPEAKRRAACMPPFCSSRHSRTGRRRFPTKVQLDSPSQQRTNNRGSASLVSSIRRKPSLPKGRMPWTARSSVPKSMRRIRRRRDEPQTGPQRTTHERPEPEQQPPQEHCIQGMQKHVDQMIPERIEPPEVIFQPEARVNERVILRRGERVRPDRKSRPRSATANYSLRRNRRPKQPARRSTGIYAISTSSSSRPTAPRRHFVSSPSS